MTERNSSIRFELNQSVDNPNFGDPFRWLYEDYTSKIFAHEKKLRVTEFYAMNTWIHYSVDSMDSIFIVSND